MKSIKDIENMSLEQLEAVSMDESIAVPEGFEARIKGAYSRRKVVRYAAAASVVIIAGVGLGIAQRAGQPKDTFDDPYLAYAELEKAFDKISASVNKSMDMANSVISEK